MEVPEQLFDKPQARDGKIKAIVYTEYGDPGVLHLEEVEKPSPKDGEVLVRVRAVSVNYGDLIARKFRDLSKSEFNMPALFRVLARFSFGFRKPKINILGNTFSGEIEALGSKVVKFREGDAVFGYTGAKMGTYAEYICFSENGIIAENPSNMTFEESSVIPYGAIMALNLLRKATIQKGQRVLILGASGGIGSAAVQLAKHHFGAEVTGVCGAQGIEFVKKLGADQVIDYRKEHASEKGETYHLIFDVLGKGSFSDYKPLLEPNGLYLSASFKTKKLLQMLRTSMGSKNKLVCALAVPKQEDLILVKELVEAGKLKAFIDKTFPLEKTAEAHRYLESGNKKAEVVITV